MPTLNVFKLARNADYNVGSPNGTTRKSLSPSSSSTSGFSSFSRNSFRSKANSYSTNSSSSSNSSSSTTRKSGSNNSGENRHPTYIQIDPDRDCELTDMDRQASSRSVVEQHQQQQQQQLNGRRNGQNGQNGNGSHDMEPEAYKRLINEAPFLTTAREPPLDLDTIDNNYEDQLCQKSSEKNSPDSIAPETTPSSSSSGIEIVANAGGDYLTDGATPPPPQSLTTTTTITSTKSNILNSIKTLSRSTSSSGQEIRKTESRISMAASTKSTTPSFDLELEWVDPKLIKEGRAFVRKHFLSVMFAHFIGMAFLLTVRPIAAILLRNTKYYKSAKRHNWHMYLLLFRRLKSWYEKGDLTNICDPVTSNILNMRRSICSAGKNFRRNFPPPASDLMLSEEEQRLHSAVREDLSNLKEIKVETKNIAKIFATVNPDVPWSQYDLAVTQFAFFGFISLFPHVFGIHNPSKRELRAFHHLWATFGHLLGLENRFNLCKEEILTRRRIEKSSNTFFSSVSKSRIMAPTG